MFWTIGLDPILNLTQTLIQSGSPRMIVCMAVLCLFRWFSILSPFENQFRGRCIFLFGSTDYKTVDPNASQYYGMLVLLISYHERVSLQTISLGIPRKTTMFHEIAG